MHSKTDWEACENCQWLSCIKAFIGLTIRAKIIGGATPSTWNYGSEWPRWCEIADIRSIFARSASAVTPCKQIQPLSRIKSLNVLRVCVISPVGMSIFNLWWHCKFVIRWWDALNWLQTTVTTAVVKWNEITLKRQALIGACSSLNFMTEWAARY